MALRRLAHENNASDPNPPSTPRNRLSYGFHRSPADTPSLSSSVPFDWEAARSKAPPPYATPSKNRPRTSLAPTPRKAVIRKKGFIERIKSLPSNIAFEIALFPQNVPLPSPKTSARIVGGAIHLTHFFIVAGHETEDGWDTLSGTQKAWLDWTTPITLLLMSISVVNAYNLCKRNRSYKFHRRTEPIASPNAKFVTTNLDLEPLELLPIGKRIRDELGYAVSYFWRFLLGFQLPGRPAFPTEKTSQVQELEIWEPNEFNLELFSIYSPAHSVLWLAMGNWILSLLVMGLVGVQLNAMTHFYSQLIKDKQIIAAETMKEYNEVFVYPRVNPVRTDVAVMTHQSEVVDVWEE